MRQYTDYRTTLNIKPEGALDNLKKAYVTIKQGCHSLTKEYNAGAPEIIGDAIVLELNQEETAQFDFMGCSHTRPRIEVNVIYIDDSRRGTNIVNMDVDENLLKEIL